MVFTDKGEIDMRKEEKMDCFGAMGFESRNLPSSSLVI